MLPRALHPPAESCDENWSPWHKSSRRSSWHAILPQAVSQGSAPTLPKLPSHDEHYDDDGVAWASGQEIQVLGQDGEERSLSKTIVGAGKISQVKDAICELYADGTESGHFNCV